MALREKELGSNENRLFACLSNDVCDPFMLPDRFFPSPSEKERRERFESIDGRMGPSSEIGWVMLTGGYFLDFSPVESWLLRLPLLPNTDPLRPKILLPMSPIVFDRLWPLESVLSASPV